MATSGTKTNALSDETFDFLCNVCKHKGKSTEAKKYCTDCYDYYCLTCVKLHDDVPSLTGHNIVDKGMFQKGSAKKLPIVPTERCDQHSLKPVDMYCQNHDQIGCSTCMAVEHRLCKDFFYIPDYVQNMTSACNPQTIKKILASTEETLKVTVQLCEQEKQHLLKRKAESIQNVRQVRKEFDKMLDQLEQASVAEIENKYEEMISKIEEEITTFRDAKRNVLAARNKLEAAGDNASQIFVTTKTGQSFATEVERMLKNKNLSCYYGDITITGDPKLKEMLEKLKSLGQITPRDLLKGMQKYPIKDQSDSYTCNIVSSCVLEDGTVILADHFNNKLKRLDRSTYCVRDHYNLPGCLWQVCAINNQEVAVSYTEKEIMFLSIGNEMTKKSVTKTDFNCCALAYANDNLYISGKYTSVYIYSVSGQKLKQLRVTGLVESWTSDLLSDSIDIRIRGLAVNKDGSRIYVANAKKGLIVLDNNGKVVRKFNEQAEDVHLTTTGTVLVCECSSGNILKLTPDGELIGEVLKGEDRCRTVCCNRQMSKIVVGTHFSNDIKVYDLV